MPELSQRQFTQGEFPGMPPVRPQPAAVSQGLEASPPPYTSIDRMNKPVTEWAQNPIHDANLYGPLAEGEPLSFGEMVPTWRVRSGQRLVHPETVEHQVQHADPFALDADPVVVELEGDEEGPLYKVQDGNHRVNAALRRGQLFTPATVRRRS